MKIEVEMHVVQDAGPGLSVLSLLDVTPIHIPP